MSILVLKSSASGPSSVSNLLVDAVVARLSQAGGRPVRERDLDLAPLPHLDQRRVAGVRAQPATVDELAAASLSDELVDELRAAQALVIGAPMYNFSLPTTLKAWFDHVLRPRVTFTYTAAGPQGLVGEKPVFVVLSRGSVYSDPARRALDFQEPYLTQLLGFMGLKDVTFIRAEGIGLGPEARDAAIAQARAEIEAKVPALEP